jgi:ribosomal protein L18
MSDHLKRAANYAIENITNNLMTAAVVGASVAREAVMAAIKEGHPLIPEEMYVAANEAASLKAMKAAVPK